MVEEVNVLYSVPSDSDVIEHQTVHQPVLHPPEELRLPQHAGGGNGDVLEGDPEHVSWVSSILVRICPGFLRLLGATLAVTIEYIVANELTRLSSKPLLLCTSLCLSLIVAR